MLKIFTIEESIEWDKKVKSFEDYDSYYLSGYVNAFKRNGDGIPLLFYYENNNLKAINIVMKRDIADDPEFNEKINRNEYFDFITPYGYGGWLIEGNGSIENLFIEYEKWCIDNNIISEFVRFHPLFENYKKVKNIYYVQHISDTIYMDLASEEIITKNMTSKCRNMVRKAIKNGLTMKEDNDFSTIELFKELYYQTMDKNNASDSYYFSDEYFLTLFHDRENIKLFNVFMENEIVGSSIVLLGKDWIHYHLSANTPLGYKFAANNLLLYSIANWGSAKGYKKFHLGGGYGGNESSLFKFKESMNKNGRLAFAIGRKIFDRKKYALLVKIAGNDRENIENNFFPLYRLKKEIK